MNAEQNEWVQVFEARAGRPLPDVTAPALDDPTRRALAAALARFQRGEAGEGRIASEVRRLPIDPAIADAIGYFVREEGRHARILKAAVHALGGQLLSGHWSDRLFTWARRRRGMDLRGFQHKMAVLAAAEIIGGAFYESVAAALPASPMRDALAEVARDERDHLAFHRSLSPPRTIVAVATIAGAALVMLDQWAALSRLRCRTAFLRRVYQETSTTVAAGTGRKITSQPPSCSDEGAAMKSRPSTSGTPPSDTVARGFSPESTRKVSEGTGPARVKLSACDVGRTA